MKASADHGPQLRHRFVQGVDRLATARDVAGHRVAHRLRQEMLDLGVVVQHRLGRKAGFGGDVLDARPRIAAVGDDATGCLDDSLSALTLSARTCHDATIAQPDLL
jgi:hypothetical protein